MSILVPGIKSNVGKMCIVQSPFLPKEILNVSNEISIQTKNIYLEISDELKFENSDIEKSIIRNCLNYVDEGTHVEFLLKNGEISKRTGLAVCKNNELLFN